MRWVHGTALWCSPATPICSRPCRAASLSGREDLRRKFATMPRVSISRRGASARNPLGSAAGYGTPNLDLSREETRRRLGFSVTQEPVTAVQLSRGKAEAQLLFEITLLTQDMGRLAADLMLFYTQEFGFVTLPEAFYDRLLDHAAKKRNPDVFELVRGPQFGRARGALRSARYHAEADFGLSPRFAADQAALVPRHRFLLADTRHTAERSRRGDLSAGKTSGSIPAFMPRPPRNALVAREGIPFREAYRRVAAKLKDSK